MRYLLALSLCLSACSTIAVEGPPGKRGPPGEPGPPAPAARSGERLTVFGFRGDDGSEIPGGAIVDDRFGACRIEQLDDEWICRPLIENATQFHSWVDPTCDGDFGWPASYREARVVRFMSGDPALYGALFGRAEEVPALYYRGPNNDGPCEILIAGTGFPPPYYRWPQVTVDDFVHGEVMP